MTINEISQKEREHILQHTPVLYKYLDFEGALKMMRSHTLKFASIPSLNDPFDCHTAMIDWTGVPKEFENNLIFPEVIQEQYQYDILNHFGIASLTDSYDNFALWCYYNYHRGVCIGLDTRRVLEHLCTLDKEIMLVQVKYSDHFHKFNYWDSLNPEAGFDVFSDHLFKIKSTASDKEKEIRLVYNGINEKRHFPCFLELPPECFVSLHLGCRMLDDDVYTLEERVFIMWNLALSINPKMEIYRMHPVFNKFSVERSRMPIKSIVEHTMEAMEELGKVLD